MNGKIWKSKSYSCSHSTLLAAFLCLINKENTKLKIKIYVKKVVGIVALDDNSNFWKKQKCISSVF